MMAATIKAIGLPTKAFGTSLCSSLSRIVEKMNNTRANPNGVPMSILTFVQSYNY